MEMEDHPGFVSHFFNAAIKYSTWRIAAGLAIQYHGQAALFDIPIGMESIWQWPFF